ncbi:MAG TPA: hypothetical protein DDW90_03610 [Cyanobacteria bacterium UBA9971]|nr:hypothetical protein [Cyanobacteria bacterium UBA9971]
MDAIKANSFSYSLITKTGTDEQKTSEHAGNIKTKQDYKNPAFGAALPVKEGVGKKALNLALNLVDKIQRKIETGGFIVEFLVVDFLGMVIPRTYQAYHRNEKELGHPNYAAAKEEFTREILSGPSMFLIPFAFLAASKKMFGSASHVKLGTLKKFKEITGQVVNKAKNNNLVQNFYNEVVEKLYGSKITKKAQNGIVEDFMALHNATSKKEVKELSKKVKETLIAANQEIGNNKKLGISMADSSKIKFDGEAKNVGDFVEECRNYSSDALKILSAAGKDANGQLIDKIHDFKEGARKLLKTTAVGTMSAFIYSVPKFYNQNKEYPGLAGLTDNSAKDDNKIIENELQKLPAKNEFALQTGEAGSSGLTPAPQKQSSALAFFAPASHVKEESKK